MEWRLLPEFLPAVGLEPVVFFLVALEDHLPVFCKWLLGVGDMWGWCRWKGVRPTLPVRLIHCSYVPVVVRLRLVKQPFEKPAFPSLPA
jgi:hypothetical protein